VTFLPGAIPGLILATLLQKNGLTFLPAALPGLKTLLQKNGLKNWLFTSV
jgi:predicted membrane protein